MSCRKYLISHFVRFIIQKVGSQSDKFRQTWKAAEMQTQGMPIPGLHLLSNK
jgi:hypothetical protein